MSKLLTMENVVLEVLEYVPETRADDYYLIYYVLLKLNKIPLLDTPFHSALLLHKELNMPSWESITRVRRKIQAKRPDLVDPNCARRRRKEEQEYREYAKAE